MLPFHGLYTKMEGPAPFYLRVHAAMVPIGNPRRNKTALALNGIKYEPIISQDIFDVLAQLQPKHSLDPSNIPMFLLKKLGHQICMPLKHIINLSLDSGEIPSSMKTAKVIPLLKSGDPSDVNNYRPISLLSSFGKILEKIVANKLVFFLESNNLLSQNQFGFRKEHSTVHPMMLLLNYLTKALNAKKHSIVIFCDLQKAFDTCDHEILLKKLSNLGIRNNELLWFKNYLSNREQYVFVFPDYSFTHFGLTMSLYALYTPLPGSLRREVRYNLRSKKRRMIYD